MTSTILTWAAPLTATAALVGLWSTSDHTARRFWRTLAITVASGSTAIMALIALPTGAGIIPAFELGAEMTATLFGVGLWLSVTALLVDEYRRPTVILQRRQTSALWNEITHELTSHEPLDAVLLNIAGAFRRDVDADCAHVYKVSQSRRRVYRTGSVYSTPSVVDFSDNEAQADLMSEFAWWGAQEHVPAMVESIDGSPIVCLPLRDDSTTYVMIMVQNPRRALPSDWKLVAAMIGRSISDWSQLALYRDTGIVAERLSTVLPGFIQEDKIEAALKAAGQALCGVVDYDYLSISSMGSSRAHEDRATMLAGADPVIENRHGWPVTGAALRRVLSTGRAVITPDLDMTADDDDHDTIPWERRLGMRSRMIVPIGNGARVIGTITLAHHSFARYSETEINLVVTVAAFLAPWMRHIESVSRANRNDRALSFIRKLEGSIFATLDEKLIVNDASDVVNATGLRVYRLDESDQSLREVATSGRLSDGDPSRPIPLSKLPWHRWALDSRRTLAIDQADPESVMGGGEATIAMDKRMKTGFLVPIVADGRPLGLVDVIEQRHPDRNVIDSGSRLVAESLATTLADRWGGKRVLPMSGVDTGALTERLKGWSRQVVNPLTSIIGSVELIRHKETKLGSEAIKYLGTIERSATRVHEAMLSIIAESTNDAGQATMFQSPDHWTWTRPSEQPNQAAAEFARPASLSEAVMRNAEATTTN